MPSPTASRGTTAPVRTPSGPPPGGFADRSTSRPTGRAGHRSASWAAHRSTSRVAGRAAGRGTGRRLVRWLVPRSVRWPARRLVRLFVAVGLTILMLALGAPPASAHAALTSSNPAQGEVVDRAPEEVVLSFSEGVSMSEDSIRVLDPEGNRADTGGPRDVGRDGETSHAVSLRSDLPDGTYTVAWRAVSADSHPVSGAFTFSVGAPSETTVKLDQPAAGGGLVGALYHLARYAAYTGFVLLVGGGAFVLACWPGGSGVRPVRRVVTGGWVTLAGSTLALLMLRAPYVGSGSLADAFDLGALQDELGTKTGTALLYRLLLVAAAALVAALLFGRRAGSGALPAPEDGAGTASGDRPEDAGSSGGAARADGGRAFGGRRGLAAGLASGGLLVAVGLAATWAMAEHASTGIQPKLAMPVDVLHLLAVAIWLGGLVSLLAGLFRGPLVPVGVVRRFSRIAFGSVVVLAVTGLYQSWRQVGSWSALVLTDFGQLLLVKVGLIAVLLGFAALSRGWTAALVAAPRNAASGQSHGNGDGDRDDNGGEDRDGDENGGGDVGTPSSEPSPQPPADALTRAGEAGRATAVASPEGSADQDPADRDTGGTTTDPVRARQLARQRQARARARQQRERERNTDPQRSGLRRSVLAEAGIALVVLSVTTALTTTEPGRTEETARPADQQQSAQSNGEPISLDIPFDTGGTAGQGTAQVQLTPGVSGANDLHVHVKGADGRPLDVPEVRVALTLEETGIGPLSAALGKVDAGHWTAAGVQVPMPGDWELALTVRTSDVDQVTEERDIRID